MELRTQRACGVSLVLSSGKIAVSSDYRDCQVTTFCTGY